MIFYRLETMSFPAQIIFPGDNEFVISHVIALESIIFILSLRAAWKNEPGLICRDHSLEIFNSSCNFDKMG